MHFTTEFRQEDGRHVAILRTSGKITIGAGDSQLREAIGGLRGWNVVLDLANVTTIDSSGIAELVGSYTSLANAHQDMVLLRIPPKLNELLHVTQLIVLFKAFDDEEKAVASFDKAA